MFFTFFPTAWGTFGIAWSDHGITGLEFPEKKTSLLLAHLSKRFPRLEEKLPSPMAKKAIGLIQEYVSGKKPDFSKIPLDLSRVPPFQKKALTALRRVGHGKTVSYGELAWAIGSPKAARAVGTAMAKNPIPLIIPCHRVLAAGNRMGGFSAPGGIKTKEKLLTFEGIDLSAAQSPKKEGGSRLPFDLKKAVAFLRKADKNLAPIIDLTGPCTLVLDPLKSPFEALLESIVGQQLHATAANRILERIERLGAGKSYPTPEEFLDFPDQKLRDAGLSGAKVMAVKDLAAKTLDGTVPTLAKLKTMSDEEIIERLTVIRGIGRWSVEMMLIFRLGRPDVLAIDDYGLLKGFAAILHSDDLPKKKEFLEYGERWRPYRSIAGWYLWRANEHAAAQKRGAGKRKNNETTREHSR